MPVLHHPILYGALVLWLALAWRVLPLPAPEGGRSRPVSSAHGWLEGVFGNDDELGLRAALVVLPPLVLGCGLLIGYIVLRSYDIRVFPRCEFPTVPWTAWHLLRCGILFLVVQRLILALVAGLQRWKAAGEWIARVPPVMVQVQEYNVIMAATCGLVIALVAAGGAQPGPTLGLTERRPVRRAALGTVAYVMVFPLFILAGLLTHLVYQAFELEIRGQQVLLEAHSLSPLAYLTFGLSVVVVAPVTEEFLFRGFLYATLRRYIGPLGAICLSAGAFAAAHEYAYGFPPLFVLGFLLAYLYERTGSLVAPIAAHAVHNFYVLAAIRLLHSPGFL